VFAYTNVRGTFNGSTSGLTCRRHGFCSSVDYIYCIIWCNLLRLRRQLKATSVKLGSTNGTADALEESCRWI